MHFLILLHYQCYCKNLKKFFSSLEIYFNIEIKNPLNEIIWPELRIRENNNSFSDQDWREIYKLSEKTSTW